MIHLVFLLSSCFAGDLDGLGDPNPGRTNKYACNHQDFRRYQGDLSKMEWPNNQPMQQQKNILIEQENVPDLPKIKRTYSDQGPEKNSIHQMQNQLNQLSDQLRKLMISVQ